MLRAVTVGRSWEEWEVTEIGKYYFVLECMASYCALRCSYSCRGCDLSYPDADIPLRYHVILNVTDHESTCVDVSVFGDSLNAIFGLPAEQFHRFWPSCAYSIDVWNNTRCVLFQPFERGLQAAYRKEARTTRCCAISPRRSGICVCWELLWFSLFLHWRTSASFWSAWTKWTEGPANLSYLWL